MMVTEPSSSPLLRLFQPVSNASLAFFRIFFGLMMVVAVVRFFAYGWVHEFYIRPYYHFTFYGFDWVRPWPGWGMYLHFGLMGLFALLLAVGLWTRLSVFCFGLLFTYAELLDKTYYLNHYYLVSLLCLLMLFLPLEKRWSLDVLWRGKERAEEAPLWTLALLRGQLGLVYFFAGVAKCRVDWLLYGQPLKLWLKTKGDFPVLGVLFVQPWVPLAMSWAGALFDLTVFGWLLWHRSRPWAYLVVIGFHVVTWWMFPIGIFPWVMIGSTLLFFSPDWPLRLWKRLSARPSDEYAAKNSSEKQGESKPVSPLQQWDWKRRGLVWMLALYLGFQILWPLRSFAYPGVLGWREEGFRFAWNVMLIEKTGYTEFRLRGRKTGRTWVVQPRRYLTALQTKMMSTQPDMILQFAHWLGQKYEKDWKEPMEVRVYAIASLNGRPRQTLIDPKVDLMQQSRGFSTKFWILPLRNLPPSR